MRNYLSVAWATLTAGMFVFAGCQTSDDVETANIEFGTGSADVNVIRISSREMEQIPAHERLVLQTSNEDDVLVFDASLIQSDFKRIDIVCPNGQQMSMMAWLSGLVAGQNVDISALIGIGFAVSRDQQNAEAAFVSMNGDPGLLGPLSEASVCSDRGEACELYDGVIVCYCV